MKTVCIVQARRRSHRLPDKVLADLAGRPALWHTLERCKRIKGVDAVVLAGIDDPHEDPLFDIGAASGVQLVRGSPDDLVARYKLAADLSGADVVMRVTADCPLLDPEVCAKVVAVRLDQGADYACTVGWPHGLDCEVFTKAILDRIDASATDAADREHVTLWLNGVRDVKKLHVQPEPEVLAAHPDMPLVYRWVLDYPEDYEFLKAMFAFPDVAAGRAGWRDLVRILDENPDIQAINQGWSQHWHKLKADLVRDSVKKKNQQ